MVSLRLVVLERVADLVVFCAFVWALVRERVVLAVAREVLVRAAEMPAVEDNHFL